MSDEHIHSTFRRWVEAAYDADQVMKDNNITQDDIENLRELSKSSDSIPKAIVDKILLIVLVATDNNIGNSVNLLHNYCKFKRETPEFFKNRDVEANGVQFCLDNQYFACLPTTPKNRNLISFQLANNNPKNYVFDEVEKTLLMIVEKCIFLNGPKDGVVFMFDMKHSRIGHVFQPSISSLIKLFKLIDHGCPFKIQEVHIMNTAPFISFILALIKPLIRSDILNRVYFHSPNVDLEKFYNDWIPKSCLPSDYGGDLDSLEKLHQEERKSLMKMREYFLYEERLMNFEFEDYDFDGHYVETVVKKDKKMCE